ncbi:hypothetical protein SDC9_84793 [bioreactor metagenome]|uniref:Uncharacterized protein n=1 Tax=bioreactor metagenome TaxID=1076179 RepID=A0A644ZBA1_9ZZZZ
MADVQALSRRVSPDIEGYLLLVHEVAEGIHIRTCLDEPTVHQGLQCVVHPTAPPACTPWWPA